MVEYENDPLLSTVLGSIGEGIVLSLIRKSGGHAIRNGEGEQEPDLMTSSYDGLSLHIEVKYRRDGRFFYENISNRCKSRRAMVIVVNSTQPVKLHCARYPYPHQGKLVTLVPLKHDRRFNEVFNIKQDAYDFCDEMVERFIIIPEKHHVRRIKEIVREKPPSQ